MRFTVNDDTATHTGLIAGPEARKVRMQKTKVVLAFTHKCHVVTTPVVSTLLGSTISNAARLLRDLVEQGLVQEVNLRYCDRAPRGRGFMLKPDGVRAVAQDLPDKAHHYNCRPETIKHDQLSHDLLLAEFAAHWVQQGGALIHTDHTLRQLMPKGKLPDLMLQWNGINVAFEYERLDKKVRELDQKLLAASEHPRFATIWLSDIEGNLQHMAERIKSAAVPIWRLSSAHKWGTDGEAYLPMDFRCRQLLVSLKPDTLSRSPQAWIDDLKSHSGAMTAKCISSLRNEGWGWGRTDPMTWRGEDIHQFHLQIDSARVTGGFFVTHMGGDSWRVCDESQTPDQGCGLERAYHWTPADDAAPPIAVVEMAVRRIKHYNFKLPR
jgi:hypothetical protein